MLTKLILIVLFLFSVVISAQEVTAIDGAVPKDHNNKTTGIMLFYADTTVSPWKFYPVFDTSGTMSVSISGVSGSGTGLNVNRIDDTKDSDLSADRNIQLTYPFPYTSASSILTVTNLDTDSSFAVEDMNGYKYFSLHLISTDVTVYVYYTLNKDASNTDMFDGNWVDYGTVILGSASVIDVSAIYSQDTPLIVEKIGIRAVTTDAGNALTTYIKKGN